MKWNCKSHSIVITAGTERQTPACTCARKSVSAHLFHLRFRSRAKRKSVEADTVAWHEKTSKKTPDTKRRCLSKARDIFYQQTHRCLLLAHRRVDDGTEHLTVQLAFRSQCKRGDGGRVKKNTRSNILAVIRYLTAIAVCVRGDGGDGTKCFQAAC